jgi:hypothetical protein
MQQKRRERPKSLPSASDVGEALSAAENALRDLIASVLGDAPDWLAKPGLKPERIEHIGERKATEVASRGAGVAAIETRDLYYAELYDLQVILDGNWHAFAACLGDRKTFDAMFDRMEEFRNPDAHGRELLPFERHLALGISGEIRNRITLFMSGTGPTKEYWPRIESMRDQFGNRVTGFATNAGPSRIDSGITLDPGDRVTFEMRAWDPENVPLRWTVHILDHRPPIEIEAHEGVHVWKVKKSDIGEEVAVLFTVISERPHHRRSGSDDFAIPTYRVLPR